MTREARLRALIGPLGWMMIEGGYSRAVSGGSRSTFVQVEWCHQDEGDDGQVVRECVGSVTAETLDEAIERALGHGGVA